MENNVKVNVKGPGLTTSEELDIFKYAEEGIKHHHTSPSQMTEHVGTHMNSKHHGQWTVFVIQSTSTNFQTEYFPVEEKYIHFGMHGHIFVVYKSHE